MGPHDLTTEAEERAQGREDFYVLRDGGLTGPLSFLAARELAEPGSKLLAVVEDYEE